MRIAPSSVYTKLAVGLFLAALMVPMVCALSSVEDSVLILSSLAEEEEGETPDVLEDSKEKIASMIEAMYQEDEGDFCISSFGYHRYVITLYSKIVIPPPDQV